MARMQLLNDVCGRRCVDNCRAGNTMRAVHQLAVRTLSQGMKDLGLFPNLSVDAIEHSTYRQVFPHSVGEPSASLQARLWRMGSECG